MSQKQQSREAGGSPNLQKKHKTQSKIMSDISIPGLWFFGDEGIVIVIVMVTVIMKYKDEKLFFGKRT